MKGLILFICLTFSLFVDGQTPTLQKWAVSIGGSYSTVGEYSHIATVGQTAASRFEVTLRNGTIGFLDDEDIILGLDEAQVEGMYRLYPNPSNGVIYISGELLRKDNVQVSLYDAQGRKVRTQVTSSDARWEIAFEEAAGLYFLVLEVADRLYTHRLVRQ